PTRPSAVSSLATASHPPLASSSIDTSAPTVATRDSTRLQPASAIRRDNTSSGESAAGATAWISNWWSVAGRSAGGFKRVTVLRFTNGRIVVSVKVSNAIIPDRCAPVQIGWCLVGRPRGARTAIHGLTFHDGRFEQAVTAARVPYHAAFAPRWSRAWKSPAAC